MGRFWTCGRGWSGASRAIARSPSARGAIAGPRWAWPSHWPATAPCPWPGVRGERQPSTTVARRERPHRRAGAPSGVPLRRGGSDRDQRKPWGAVLAATSEERVFSDEEKHGLERFADLVGLAIANADARSRLVARAASDPLTGLANHRTVHETIRREVARAHRHKRPSPSRCSTSTTSRRSTTSTATRSATACSRRSRTPCRGSPARTTSWGASGARSSCGSCPRPTRWARTTPPSGSARWSDRASRRRASRLRSRRASATWSRPAPRRSSWPSPTAPSTGPRPTGATSPSSTRPRS